MKLQLLPLALLGAIAVNPLWSTAAQAQTSQRICIVDDDTREVYCGRVASQDEIRRAGLGRGRSSGVRFGGRRGDRDDGRIRYDSRGNRVLSNRQKGQIRRALDDLYEDVLGRDLDEAGFDTYLDRITNDDWSLAKVRQDLAESREARDRLNDIYREVLGREIDSDGLRTYRRQLARDKSLRDIRRTVERSDEARRVRERR